MEPVSASERSNAHLRSFRGRVRAYARRYAQVLRVIIRFGLEAFAYELDILPRRMRRKTDVALTALELPERLRLALEELGSAFVKLGQWLASRGDLIPAAYVMELRKLQDHVSPVPIEEIEEVIRQELGAEPGDLFEYFDPEPRATASIGQVHFARLQGGQPVAVKVQRPGIAEAMETDLHILMLHAAQAERVFPWAAENRVRDLVQEFVRTLREELDFLNEAHNTTRLQTNLKSEPTVVVPSIVWPLTTQRILVQEWIEGAKPGDEEAMARFRVDAKAAAQNLFRQMIRQILRDGYFHGDPHAGNVLFLGGDRLAFLDCGNAVAIDRHTRDGLVSLLMAVLNDDPQEVCDFVLMLGVAGDRTDPQRLTNDIGRMMAHYKGFRNTSQISIARALDDLLGVVLRHGVRMQPAFAAIGKSMLVTEGLCLQLDPDFDAQGVVRAEGRAMLRDRLRPLRVGEDVWRFARTLQRYALLLPRQVSHVLARTQMGGLKLRVSHENLERPLHRLDLMVNRIVFAIVVSAIIGSSTNLLLGRTVSGSLGEYLTYGYLIVGVVLGGWLLFSILRSGRL